MDVAIQVGKSLRIYMTALEDIEMMTDGCIINKQTLSLEEAGMILDPIITSSPIREEGLALR